MGPDFSASGSIRKVSPLRKQNTLDRASARRSVAGHAMKECKYCGRENPVHVAACLECGTDEFKPFIPPVTGITTPLAVQKTKEPPHGPPPSEVKIATALLAIGLALEVISTIKLMVKVPDATVLLGIRIAVRFVFASLLMWFLLRGSRTGQRITVALCGVGIVSWAVRIPAGLSTMTISSLVQVALLLASIVLLLQRRPSRWFNREDAPPVSSP
jgi:hypothetical protein